MLQASLIALGVGFSLRGVVSPAPAATWPYVLFAYAVFAVLVPWLAGGSVREQLNPRLSLILGGLFAAPMWLAARWLADSPYPVLVLACRAMIGLWVLHLVVSSIMRIAVHVHTPTEEP